MVLTNSIYSVHCEQFITALEMNMLFYGRNFQVKIFTKNSLYCLIGCILFALLLYIPIIQYFKLPVGYYFPITGECIKVTELRDDGSLIEHDCAWAKGKRYTIVYISPPILN